MHQIEVAAGGRMRGADYVIKRIAFAVVTVFVAITINFVAVPARAGQRRLEPLARAARDAGDCGTR